MTKQPFSASKLAGAQCRRQGDVFCEYEIVYDFYWHYISSDFNSLNPIRLRCDEICQKESACIMRQAESSSRKAVMASLVCLPTIQSAIPTI